ncbi:MAG: MFS transporter [Alphaproteobacteria bacterium]|nr:MFS transporter [Alphaproteobacteria bacterium]
MNIKIDRKMAFCIPFVFLGFAAGLPLLLVYSTLTAWLFELGISKTTIGFFAWVSIAYSFKFLWAPLVDHMPIWKLTRRFGHRRSWLLVSQVGVLIGLLLMASIDPGKNLVLFALCALLVAVSSATQDITLDAYRIEYAPDEKQGILIAAYQFGYRTAMLIAGAGALILAEQYSWSTTYVAASTLMFVGMVTVLLVKETKPYKNSALDQNAPPPLRRRSSVEWLAELYRVLILPMTDIIQRYRWEAIIILSFVGLFRISDLAMAIMVNPFLLETGFTKLQIAEISKLYGFIMVLVGAAIGGGIVSRFGVVSPLLVGSILVSFSNLAFLLVAKQAGPEVFWLIVAVSIENLASGFAGTVFIAFLSSLTSRSFTATQYALLSSFMLMPGKFISGFSGIVVDGFGYDSFFVYSTLLGIPSIFLAAGLIFMKSRAASESGRDTLT